METCQNCGRESHCGVDVKMQVNAHDVGIYEVLVCRHCRCKNCQPEESENVGDD